ncbi:MAG: IS3 family transposase [Rhizobiaceae bacterium]
MVCTKATWYRGGLRIHDCEPGRLFGPDDVTDFGCFSKWFYAYCSRPPSCSSIEDEAFGKRIAKIHDRSKQAHGAPPIHVDVIDEGVCVGRRRVERLMQAKGLRGVSRRNFVVTTERDPRARPASDLVDRNFYADAPNVLWVADMTYVPGQAFCIWLWCWMPKVAASLARPRSPAPLVERLRRRPKPHRRVVPKVLWRSLLFTLVAVQLVEAVGMVAQAGDWHRTHQTR